MSGLTDRQHVVAAAIVDDLDRPTRLLAARRTEPPALAGGWELPGGKVDPGETADEALHREIREELGVTVRTGALLPAPTEDGRWPLGDRYRMTVWLAVVVEGDPQPIEDHDALSVAGPRRPVCAWAGCPRTCPSCGPWRH